MARSPPFGDRLSGEKLTARGEALVNAKVRIVMPAACQTLLRRAALALAVPLAAFVAAATAHATTIERVVSKGGIEAWLVHEPAVPLIAIDFAFAGGAAQDPPGKAGTAHLTASLLRDRAGGLDFKAIS